MKLPLPMRQEMPEVDSAVAAPEPSAASSPTTEDLPPDLTTDVLPPVLLPLLASSGPEVAVD